MVPPWFALGFATILIGLSKCGVPGLSVLIAPLFAVATPGRASTGLLLPLLIVGDVCAVAFYRRHAVWKHLIRLFPFAAVGIVAGYFAMGRITDSQFGPIVGVITLVILAVNFWRSRRAATQDAPPSRIWFAALFGLAGGFATMIANAAGAIMLVYLISMRLPKDEFIGTSAWYFFALNVFKIPFSLALGFITAPSLGLNLRLAPLVAVGAVAGYFLARRIPQSVFNIVVQILAAASAVFLIL